MKDEATVAATAEESSVQVAATPSAAEEVARKEAALEEQAWLACWQGGEDEEFGEDWRKAKFLHSIRIFHEDARTFIRDLPADAPPYDLVYGDAYTDAALKYM